MTIFGMFTQIFGRVGVETPNYKTIKSTDEYEIRNYPPCVAAQVTYDPSQVNDTDGHGFKILADYIGALGNPKNVKNATPESIEMTAPVITKEEGSSSSEPISMTAPVVTKSDGEGGVMTMQFLLPEKYMSVEEAPRPVDERVEIKEVGERKYGVVRFSGVVRSLKDKVAAEKVEMLRKCLERDGFRVIGEPLLARYNPPWTLPFLRTNEILMPIQ